MFLDMSLAGLSIEDLCHGHNDWRNIQEVVRAAFKILYDSSVAQQEKIRHLEAELASRPTLAEIEASHRQIYAVLASKVDTSEVNRLWFANIFSMVVSSVAELKKCTEILRSSRMRLSCARR